MLVEPYANELKSSIIEIPLTARERSMMVEIHATVVAVGPEAWKEEKEPRANVGDKVLVSKYCGAILSGPADGKLYRMINAEDLFARITKEAKIDD